jgi:hypothetical protein
MNAKPLSGFPSRVAPLLVLAACSGGPGGESVSSSGSTVNAGNGPILGVAGKCLDDSADGTADGNRIQLWDCNGSAAQSWTYQNGAFVGPGGKCLDVQWGNTAAGTIVQLWECNGTPAQQWTISGQQIVGIGGMCLDDQWSGTANGNQIQIWGCNGTAAQQWTVTGAGSAGGSSSGGGGGGSSGGGGGTPGPSGGFHVASGQIIGPDGNAFIAKGIDVDQGISGAQVAALFPGINFVRMPSGPDTSVSYLQSEVTSFTSLGIVVEIEDHPWPEVAPKTGSDLTTETSWYASLASAFAGNPYVWFGTMNEPQTAYGAAEAAISTQEAAIYSAIRGAGSDAIVMMELMGGGNPGTIGAGYGMTPETYASMTNVVWDLHFYGWSSGYSTDQATVDAALLGSPGSGQGILAAQTITSGDGTVPVLIGEYGDSTDGQSVDPNASQVVTAVETSGYGSSAWEDSPSTGGADILVSGGQLTSYGQTVAGYIAGK